jgi:hypothetical protein
MDNAYLPAISALVGSAIGALASFATTWLTQSSTERLLSGNAPGAAGGRHRSIADGGRTATKVRIPIWAPLRSAAAGRIRQRLAFRRRLTGALLDRLTHHVSILTMNGDSYRLRQSAGRHSADSAGAEQNQATAEIIDPDTGEITPVEPRPTPACFYAATLAWNGTAVDMADLAASLNPPAIRTEAAEALRSLIEMVVLTPDAASPDGLRAEPHGALATILTLASTGAPDAGANRRTGRRGVLGCDRTGTGVLGSQLSVVAGIGFEPMTFRL